jgi:hypothetical protein
LLQALRSVTYTERSHFNEIKGKKKTGKQELISFRTEKKKKKSFRSHQALKFSMWIHATHLTARSHNITIMVQYYVLFPFFFLKKKSDVILLQVFFPFMFIFIYNENFNLSKE